MDNVNKDVVNFYEKLGFSLVEIKSSVFRVEESTLVFQTDHKDHTVDASTILYSDAERVYLEANQAGREEAVETERNIIKEWLKTQVNDGGGQCIHYEEILEALQDNK